MSILDMFRSAAPANANNPAAAQQQAIPAPQQPTTAQTPDQLPAAQPAPAPLDAFKDLWKTDANANAAEPLFNLDPAKISEAASKANFASGVNQELVTKALQGDAAAFQQAINMASQQAFAQSTIAATKLIEQALAKHDETQQQRLPGLVKSSMVADSLQSNPLYQHEATRPLLEALKVQMAAKHPNATAAEITAHAQNYIAEFAKVAGASAPNASNTGQPSPQQQEQDWSDFF